MALRRIQGIMAIVLAALIAVACRQRDPSPVRQIDLLASVDHAERRPRAEQETATFATLAGETERALSVPGNSRVVWSVRLPDHAVLHTALGASPGLAAATGARAIFRIGISDDRTYDGLFATELSPGSAQGWTPVSVDLSKYSGFKWSLFYRPREKTWNVIFNTTITGLGRPIAAPDRLLWARPVIEKTAGT